MRSHIFEIFLTLVLLVNLSGCSAPMVILPDDIGRDGLLVGQVSSKTWPEVLKGDPMVASVDRTFGRKTLLSGLREGNLVIPLKPGEYELIRIRFEDPPFGNFIHFRDYPINKKFTIKSGMATNIGMIAFEPPVGEQAILPAFVDNSSEMVAFLQERHPKLFASLKKRELIADIEPEVSEAKLRKIRSYLAKKAIEATDWTTGAEIATSALGTIVHFGRDKEGKPRPFRFVESGTVADLSHCGIHKSRAVCIVARDTYLLVESDKAVRKKAPEGVAINSSAAFGSTGILLVDDFMRMHVSHDNGATWSVFDGAARKRPVARNGYKPMALNDFGIVLGEKGYYVFERESDGDDAPMVYGEFETFSHRVIDVPDTAEEIRQVMAVAGGLIVGPTDTNVMNGRLHRFALNSGEWKVIEIPTHGCYTMFVDWTGNDITVLCARGEEQQTLDGGLTWKQVTAPTTYRDVFPFSRFKDKNADAPSRTDKEIQLVFDKEKKALFDIYTRELRDSPTLGGKMVLRIIIEPDGSVSACKVESSTIGSAALVDSVVAKVKNINFGPKDGARRVAVSYPIQFMSAKDGKPVSR